MWLEPLERRQVLTAAVSFDALPFSEDPTTHNLAIHYSLSQAATAPLSVTLSGRDAAVAQRLVTQAISDPALLTAGPHVFTLSKAFDKDPQVDYHLSAVLSLGAVSVTSPDYSGVFQDAGNVIEVFGTSNNDRVSIGTAAGPANQPQVRVTLNGVDHFYNQAAVSGIHVRAEEGDDVVGFDQNVSLPFLAFGGAGNDTIAGSTGSNFIYGGEGADIISIINSASASVTGTASSTLSITSASHGSISAGYSVADGNSSFAVDSQTTNVTSSGITHFVINARTVSLNNIALDQYYDVITDSTNRAGDIYFSGTVTVPASFTLSDQALLVKNESSATLHGGFANDTSITIGSVANNRIEYINDVTVATASYSGDVQVTTSKILTPDDAIPRFVTGWLNSGATNLNKSIASGSWSNPNIWSLGHVPTTNELVKIIAGTTVGYGTSDNTHAIGAIEIDGSLVFGTQINTQLLVGTVEVMPGGMLQIGTVAASIASNVSAQLTIANQALDTKGIDPKQYGTGLIAYGTVSIHASPIGALGATTAQTWSTLQTEPHALDTTLVLASPAPIGWSAQDQLVLPDTRQPQTTWDKQLVANAGANAIATQSEVVTIDHFSPDRKTVYLQGRVTFDHLGAHNVSGGLELLPQTALLDRNVVIASQNPNGTRGHTFYGGRADVDIEYTRFSNLGRTDAMVGLDSTTVVSGVVTHVGSNQVGRYAVHFHHLLGPINATNTGYQFEFVGNTIDASKKWAMAVHNTSYGLIADNVVYDAQGAGFVTEDGSEVYNAFLNNITIHMHGTYEDGNVGIDQNNNPAANDYGRGGVGFWMRRSGNDVEGNVSADNTFAGIVITSYYDLAPKDLPNFRGADIHVDGQFTPTFLNPAGTIANNEIYGIGQFGLWVAYIQGDNLRDNQPQVVFDHLTMWNAALRSFAYVYHTSNVTFDRLLILGNENALNRSDWGTDGIYMAKYEDLHVVVQNSRIEGTYVGIVTPPSDGSPYGATPTPTIVRNSTLKNYINIQVMPAVVHRLGDGNYLQLDNDLFTPVGLTATATRGTPLNIQMDLAGSGDPRELTQYSIVRVTSYNQVSGVDFQVYYKEQAADVIMQTSDPSYFSRQVEGQVGAPVGSYLTNQQAWTTYGVATAGLVAPANATASRPEIDGLVGPVGSFVDPATFAPKVQLVTPWNGAAFVAQTDAVVPYVLLRYNVLGVVPPGGAAKFSLTIGVKTTFYTAPIPNRTLLNLKVGHYTLRGYVVDSGNRVIAGSSTQASFDILPQGLYNVTSSPFPAIAGAQSDPILVSELLIAAGVQARTALTSGLVITAAFGVQGSWQYTDITQHWQTLPTVSMTNAFALPATAQLRFVVANAYHYSSSDAAPKLVFRTWDATTGGPFQALNIGSSLFSSHVGIRSVTLSQPLLAG